MHIFPGGHLHLFGFDDDPPLVVAAVQANVVRQLRFVALGTRCKVREGRLLMTLSLAASGLGNLSFG